MFCSYAQTKLVSPSGRDVAQRQRGQAPSRLRTDQTCLSLWERCRAATERACISYILSLVCLMRTSQRAALSVICCANASSPKGRAKKLVRTAHMPHQVIFCADLPACCSFRHGLRRATFLREEGFGFTHRPNLSLPLGEMSRSDREGLY